MVILVSAYEPKNPFVTGEAGPAVEGQELQLSLNLSPVPMLVLEIRAAGSGKGKNVT